MTLRQVAPDPRTFTVDEPCPQCGQSKVIGILLDKNATDGGNPHMHTWYVCRYWAAGSQDRCGWTGWFVPEAQT